MLSRPIPVFSVVPGCNTILKSSDQVNRVAHEVTVPSASWHRNGHYRGLMADLWCRTCGGPIIETGLQLSLREHEAFKPQDIRWNVLMQCLGCFAPNKNARLSPTAARVQDRVLFHLVTKGIVRVGYTKLPPINVEIDVKTNGHHVTARNYIGQAVSGISGLWVSTHHHRPYRSDPPIGGYVLGHLRTSNTPCNCKMP
jgi:hypothetical protein